MLDIAVANVAVVYFIPKKYRFWSMTGLHTHRGREELVRRSLHEEYEGIKACVIFGGKLLE